MASISEPITSRRTFIELVDNDGEWLVRLVEGGRETIHAFRSERFAIALARRECLRLGLKEAKRGCSAALQSQRAEPSRKADRCPFRPRLKGNSPFPHRGNATMSCNRRACSAFLLAPSLKEEMHAADLDFPVAPVRRSPPSRVASDLEINGRWQ